MCLVTGITPVHTVSVCVTETPHRSNQDGAEGPLLVHPTPDVLDPVRPKGTSELLFLLKKDTSLVSSGNCAKLCISVKGF